MGSTIIEKASFLMILDKYRKSLSEENRKAVAATWVDMELDDQFDTLAEIQEVLNIKLNEHSYDNEYIKSKRKKINDILFTDASDYYLAQLKAMRLALLSYDLFVIHIYIAVKYGIFSDFLYNVAFTIYIISDERYADPTTYANYLAIIYHNIDNFITNNKLDRKDLNFSISHSFKQTLLNVLNRLEFISKGIDIKSIEPVDQNIIDKAAELVKTIDKCEDLFYESEDIISSEIVCITSEDDLTEGNLELLEKAIKNLTELKELMKDYLRKEGSID